MAKLILKSGDMTGLEYEVKDGLVMGRRLEAPIHLNDVKASREHARIAAEGGAFVLVDLESTNGTFVNGAKIRRHRLAHDDVIRIGRTLFAFHDPAAAAPPVAQPAAKPIRIETPPPKKIDASLKPTRSRRDRLR